MVPRMKLRLGIFLLATAAACGGEVDLYERTAHIENGNNAGAFGHALALISDGTTNCSLTMIGNQLGLTRLGCPGAGASVQLENQTSKVKTERFLANSGVLRVLQLDKPFELRNPSGKPDTDTSSFIRGFDRTPLAVGEAVSCFGYDGTRIHYGAFEVVPNDVQGDRTIHLVPLIANLIVSEDDLGGFCHREPGTHIAAILIGSTGGVVHADPVDLISVADIERLKELVPITERALRFRLPKDPGSFIELGGPSGLQLDPVQDAQIDQGFYTRELVRDGYELRSAANGYCLAMDHAGIRQELCDGLVPPNSPQLWRLYDHPDGGVALSASGFVLSVSQQHANELVPAAFPGVAGSQRWDMWIAPF